MFHALYNEILFRIVSNHLPVLASMKTVVPCQHVVGAHSVKFKTLIMRGQHHHSKSVGYLAMSFPE